MTNKKSTWIFVTMVTLAALTISGTAAYFSVFGLSKLFAGAGISAIILFGALEAGKLISVSVLYRYWENFSIKIRSLFISMIIGIMIITSLGIYGFLQNAYQSTSNKLGVIDSQAMVLKNRKLSYENQVTNSQKLVDQKNNRITSLTNIRNDQENRVTQLYEQSTDTNITSNQSWVYRTRAKENQDMITETDNQISDLNEEIKTELSKISIINDSINKIDERLITLENSDVSVEIGPLKYLSEVTGKSMDTVVFWLIMLIIFVFDPFAVLLFIVANRLSMLPNEISESFQEKYSPVIEEKIKEEVPEVKEEEGIKEEKIEENSKEEEIKTDDQEEVVSYEIKEEVPEVKEEQGIKEEKIEENSKEEEIKTEEYEEEISVPGRSMRGRGYIPMKKKKVNRIKRI